MIGKQKKYDIAYILATFLDRDERYTSRSIEKYVRENVKWEILEDPCYTPDHLRVAMVDNGFLIRDAATDEYWVAEDFEGAHDVFANRIAEYQQIMSDDPDSRFRCSFCGKALKGKALLNHFLKKHEKKEYWETTIESYFGQ